MDNVLSFTLGLTTTGFLSKLAGVGPAVGGLVATLTSFGGVMAGVWGRIEKGAELDVLSRKTGVAVGELYQLQRAFRAVGLEEGTVETMIVRMQRSLGGFNDLGAPAKDVFKSLGLSVEELKKTGMVERIERIGTALGKLPADEAMKKAQMIFGGGHAMGSGSGIMLLARSSEEFALALKKAREEGDLLERNAAGWFKLYRSVDDLKLKLKGAFSGLAEGLAPVLKKMSDALNGMNLRAVGAGIGDWFKGLTMAIGDGRLGQLLSLTLQAGISQAAQFLGAAFTVALQAVPAMEIMSSWVAEAGIRAVELAKLAQGQARADILRWRAGVAREFGFGGAAGIYEKKAEGMEFTTGTQLTRQEEAEAVRRKKLVEDTAKSMMEGMKAAKKAMGEAFGVTPEMKALQGFVEELKKGWDLKFGGKGRELRGPGGEGAEGAPAGRGHKDSKVEANALEKIGAIFGGGASGVEYARATASNTGLMVPLLRQINKGIGSLEVGTGELSHV